MLYKYIDKIWSFCDKAERQNWTTYEAVQYIKDNIKRLSDDELDEMSASDLASNVINPVNSDFGNADNNHVTYDGLGVRPCFML